MEQEVPESVKKELAELNARMGVLRDQYNLPPGGTPPAA